MMNPRIAVSALTVGLMLSSAGNTPADQPQKGPRVERGALQLPITGSAAGGVTFAGTLSVQKFVVHEGHAVAVVFVRGTAMSAGAPLGTVLVGPITLPVTVGPTTLEPTTTAPVPLQTTCPGVHIDIGATNLNVLGLVVATQPVGLDISGDSAGVLGHLVCTILDTLNNVVGLVDLLNQLLGVLTGLLGGLVP